jgi:hypothetical protein
MVNFDQHAAVASLLADFLAPASDGGRDGP